MQTIKYSYPNEQPVSPILIYCTQVTFLIISIAYHLSCHQLQGLGLGQHAKWNKLSFLIFIYSLISRQYYIALLIRLSLKLGHHVLYNSQPIFFFTMLFIRWTLKIKHVYLVDFKDKFSIQIMQYIHFSSNHVLTQFFVTFSGRKRIYYISISFH